MMSGDEFYDDEITSGPINENLVLAEVLDRTATQEERDEAKALWDALPEWRKQDIRDEIELDLL